MRIAIAGLAEIAQRLGDARTDTLPQLCGGGVGERDDQYLVDAKANPNYKPGQDCANCLQSHGKPGDAQLPCNIFPGKLVQAKGWCKVWVKRP